MSKSWKIKLIAGVIVCVIISLLVVFIVNIVDNNRREKEELELRIDEMIDQLFYADMMFFENNMTVSFNWAASAVAGDREVPTTGQKLSDVVFVLTEEAAIGFPEGVLVAWPTEDTVLWMEEANRNLPLNRDIVEERGGNLLIFDSLPLTLDLIVNDWEHMNELMNDLKDWQDTISRDR